MLEQWEANQLLATPKIYSYEAIVDLSRGADNDYQVETDDGTEFFLLDVRGPGRNPAKARFQLRYRRDVVLARMCLTVSHTNPDGERIGAPHFHQYREGYDDKFAGVCRHFDSLTEALTNFCGRINLPAPSTHGGMS
jgi:hypothetical protein